MICRQAAKAALVLNSRGSKGDGGETMAYHKGLNIAITRKELQRLQPARYLSDQLVNLGMGLLQVLTPACQIECVCTSCASGKWQGAGTSQVMASSAALSCTCSHSSRHAIQM